MQKPQVRVDHVAAEQGEETELAGAAVDARGRPVARRIGVRDPLGQRQAGRIRRGIRRGRRRTGAGLLRDDGCDRRSEEEQGHRKTLLHHALLIRDDGAIVLRGRGR